MEVLVSLISLSALEVVLGVDNLVILTVIVSRLAKEQQAKARFIGLSLALGLRVALLTVANWMVHLTEPLFSVVGHAFTGRDLILLAGGLFLVTKASREIHAEMNGHSHEAGNETKAKTSFKAAIIEIGIMDMIFALDSIITAVGMARSLWVMITAVVIAIIAMQLFAGKFGQFLEQHPTVKMLALSFLFAIGATLVAEGWGEHINKSYLYACMGFAALVETLNMRRKSQIAKHAAQTREEHHFTNYPTILRSTPTDLT